MILFPNDSTDHTSSNKRVCCTDRLLNPDTGMFHITIITTPTSTMRLAMATAPSAMIVWESESHPTENR